MLTALTICTPTKFGNGLITANEAEGIVVPEEFRCFFPAQVVAASKLSAEQQIAYYMNAESPWDTVVFEQATAACDLTTEDLSAAAAEAEAAFDG